MSKLAVTVTLAVIFIVTFSDARSPLDLTQNDVTETQSDVILLPSQKLESESESKPAKEEPNHNLQAEPDNFHTVDLTKIGFRPESRQFHDRIVPLSFRVPLRRGHGCRHEHKLFRHRRESPQREVSFGDDMNVEKEKFRSEFGPRPIFPVRLIRIHHRNPRFGNMDMGWDDEMTVPHIHRHGRFALADEEGEEKGEEKEKEKGKGKEFHHQHHHHHHHYPRYPRYVFKERDVNGESNGLFDKIGRFFHDF